MNAKDIIITVVGSVAAVAAYRTPTHGVVGMDNTYTGVILSTKVVPDYLRITVHLYLRISTMFRNR